jgi:hypothetical protein
LAARLWCGISPPSQAGATTARASKRGTEGLEDLLQPVQVTDRHLEVGGVSALAPALPSSPRSRSRPEQQPQQPLGLAIGEQPGAELAQAPRRQSQGHAGQGLAGISSPAVLAPRRRPADRCGLDELPAPAPAPAAPVTTLDVAGFGGRLCDELVEDWRIEYKTVGPTAPLVT